MPPSRGMHYPAALLLLRAMGVHVGLLWTVRVGFAKHREDCSTRTVAPVLQNLHIDISWSIQCAQSASNVVWDGVRGKAQCGEVSRG